MWRDTRLTSHVRQYTAPGTCSYKLHLRTSLGSGTVGMYEPYVTVISESHLRLASVRDPRVHYTAAGRAGAQ